MTREEIIKDLRYIKNMNSNSLRQGRAIDEAIKSLESQRTGHWIIELDSREYIEGWKKMNCKCSNCGKILISQDYNDSLDYEEESQDLLQSKYVTKAIYCSNCGAFMKGE